MRKRAKPQPAKPTPIKRPRPYLMISKECFEKFFWLDGPGRRIAMDALSADVISTSYEAVDILCLANLLYQDAILELIAADMAAHGRTVDYENVTQEEMRRLTVEAFEILGDDRIRAIIREAEAAVREQLGVPETSAEWLPWFLTAPVH